MATRYAVASGNWSNVATWDGGVSLPGAGDDVYADGKTINIDQDITVGTITNNKRTGGTDRGQFLIASGFTLNCNIVGGSVNGVQTPVLVCSHASGIVIVNGNVKGGYYTIGISNTSSGNLTVNGNVDGSITPNRYGTGIVNDSTGSVRVVGYVKGNSYSNGIDNTGTGSVYVQGLLVGITSTFPALNNRLSGKIDIVGDIQICGLVNNTGNVDVIGNITGGINYYAIALSSSVIINVTGNLTASGNTAVYAGVAVTANINGTVTASAGAVGVYLYATSVVTVSGVVNGSVNHPGVYSPLGTVKVLANCYGVNGINPICSYKLMIDPSAPVIYSIQDTNLITKPLYSAEALLGEPAPEDVRKDTAYGPSLELTGTLAVPPAESVGIGVPVDDTVGTAAVTPANIEAALLAYGACKTSDLASIEPPDFDAALTAYGAAKTSDLANIKVGGQGNVESNAKFQDQYH